MSVPALRRDRHSEWGPRARQGDDAGCVASARRGEEVDAVEVGGRTVGFATCLGRADLRRFEEGRTGRERAIGAERIDVGDLGCEGGCGCDQRYESPSDATREHAGASQGRQDAATAHAWVVDLEQLEDKFRQA